MLRPLIAFVLLATPAMAEIPRPDIDEAWAIARATALDFSSTPEGYAARLSQDSAAPAALTLRRFSEITDPMFLSFAANRRDAGQVREVDCTRVGPEGLALLQDHSLRLEGFEDRNGDGAKSADEPQASEASRDGLPLMGAWARKYGAEDAILLSCFDVQHIGAFDGALDHLLALVGPEFDHIERAGSRASLTSGKPGSEGQILMLDISIIPGADADTAGLMIRTVSRSAPSS